MKYNVKDNLIYGAAVGVVVTGWIMVFDKLMGVNNTESEERTTKLAKEALSILTRNKKEALEKVEQDKQDKF